MCVRRRPAPPHKHHHLPDLDHGEGDGDPGCAREHPRWLGHVLLVLLVFGLSDGGHSGQVERTGAAAAGSGDGGDVLTLHQVDGGDGNGAGRDGDVLSQDLVL